uniref:Uncharacterized protein n=1 Tax=Arundo donax TaxID=35708 RepID=A0A0A9EBK9_ARUDO
MCCWRGTAPWRPATARPARRPPRPAAARALAG